MEAGLLPVRLHLLLTHLDDVISGDIRSIDRMPLPLCSGPGRGENVLKLGLGLGGGGAVSALQQGDGGHVQPVSRRVSYVIPNVIIESILCVINVKVSRCLELPDFVCLSLIIHLFINVFFFFICLNRNEVSVGKNNPYN